MSWYYGFRPYVPVARRRANAAAHAAKLAKKEKRTLEPIQLSGRTIAGSFWGNAWCEHLERYSDFANRLPRGRTYVRNGSVIDLQIQRGKVKAIVSGSEIYQVTITIETLPAAAWSKIKKDCARSIDSLLDLLQGRFDRGIMERLTQPDGGLFPRPHEIDMDCTCPDWAGMCKHVAATLYGVGARLDTAPELLFTLRAVDHLELIRQAVDAENLQATLKGQGDATLAEGDLEKIFGIDLDTAESPPKASGKRGRRSATAIPSAAPVRPRAARKPTGKRPSVRKMPKAKHGEPLPAPVAASTKKASRKPKRQTPGGS